MNLRNILWHYLETRISNTSQGLCIVQNIHQKSNLCLSSPSPYHTYSIVHYKFEQILNNTYMNFLYPHTRNTVNVTRNGKKFFQCPKTP